MTAASDNTIKVWDAFTGSGVATCTGAFLASQPTPVLMDGMVACASDNGYVCFWGLPGNSSSKLSSSVTRVRGSRQDTSTHTEEETVQLEGNMLRAVRTDQKAVTAMCASARTGRYAYATACGAIWVA